MQPQQRCGSFMKRATISSSSSGRSSRCRLLIFFDLAAHDILLRLRLHGRKTLQLLFQAGSALIKGISAF
jgi:hypothetical protein